MSDQRLDDTVALVTESVKGRVNTVNEENLKIGIKIHRDKKINDKY